MFLTWGNLLAVGDGGDSHDDENNGDDDDSDDDDDDYDGGHALWDKSRSF